LYQRTKAEAKSFHSFLTATSPNWSPPTCRWRGTKAGTICGTMYRRDWYKKSRVIYHVKELKAVTCHLSNDSDKKGKDYFLDERLSSPRRHSRTSPWRSDKQICCIFVSLVENMLSYRIALTLMKLKNPTSIFNVWKHPWCDYLYRSLLFLASVKKIDYISYVPNFCYEPTIGSILRQTFRPVNRFISWRRDINAIHRGHRKGV